NHNNIKDFKHKFDNAESGFTLDTKQLFNFNVNFIIPRSEKVEYFMFNVENILKKLKDNQDFIYILDSLDGLSDDREEKKHKEDMVKVKKAIKENKDSDIKGDYSGKAKGMSQFLRQNNKKINKTKMHLLITSQLRDKPGVIYGKKEDRSGGKALNFYASQIMWLKVIRKLNKKISVNDNEYERKTGTLIRVDVTKNKLGKPFRNCFLFIDLDYGIDNIKSNIYFLYNLITPEGELRKPTTTIINDEKKKERIDGLIWDDKKFTLNTLINHIEDNNLEKELEKRVIKLWNEIEEKIIVKRKKKY
ncbi:MAG: P-loop NTPase family protein, partial [Planctomycetota bacterium]